ncbi:MAG: 2-oxoglutarate dehydrogenase E1 component [Capsulimonadaceae bacterium]
MSELQQFHGPNAGYVLDLYDRYLADPASVDAETSAIFKRWQPEDVDGANTPSVSTGIDVDKIVRASRVAEFVRALGHVTAHVDPLGSTPPGDPGLLLSTHGLTTADLSDMPSSVVGGPLAEGAANALEALGRLRKAYSGPIGYEDDHIHVHEERDWMVDAIESGRYFRGFFPSHQRNVLQRLTEVEAFERFLHHTFIGQKRFSIEGNDMLVPMLDSIINDASECGTREIVIGMAHRGRLNVLAHILGKPYAQIIAEFQVAKKDVHLKDDAFPAAGPGNRGWTGDVKYHLGAEVQYSGHGARMPITLAPNPSHLEYVNPVIVGRARAAQEARNKGPKPHQDPTASLAILIHGDAAFPGQGIVAETLNLSQLAGYHVGGTIHIIVNNQIGFTTGPREARSTLYASDLAKGFEIPIVHVNADDPEACIAASRMAHAYRERFGKDFLIDLIGYRRYGHNEADEPMYTQPRMYEKINAHPTVREIWAVELTRRGVVTPDEVSAMSAAIDEKLQAARSKPSGKGLSRGAVEGQFVEFAAIDTRVPADLLKTINEELQFRPSGFTTNAKLEKILRRRQTGIYEPGGIEWNHAEALAFASILAEGKPVRLTGQDAERGTFSTRHCVLHDPITGERTIPLQEFSHSRASFAVHNSPLSESAALGFEYGYSMHAAGVLVLWEAQFGDFINSAQVIVDQFLVSGQAKWRQAPSLVLLLPHGYEGGGPEHSSGRVERFLQLCAGDNMRVLNCTTAGQYFHALRAQAITSEKAPRPLIIMTPKALLRHPRASSSLKDLTDLRFRPVIDDPEAHEHVEQISRLILCSGKIYVDMITSPAYAVGHDGIAVARVEQLHPFPFAELRAVIAGYPGLREIVWLQEEPRNMGAWSYVLECLRELAGTRLELTYVGRPEGASPAEGSIRRHTVEQNRIITAALSDVPAAKLRRSGVKNAR